MGENTLSSRRSLYLRAFSVFLFVSFVFALRQIYLFGLPEIFESPLQRLNSLKVESIQIQADWPLTVAQVESYLPKTVGRNILLVDPRTLYDTLINKPWVKDITVKKDYPNRLRLFVETKKPRAVTLWQGNLYFIDVDGNRIDRVTAAWLKPLDVPFLSFDAKEKEWKMEQVFHFYDVVKGKLSPKFAVSQVVLGTFPYIKIFLTKPKVEVMMSMENWESQLPTLMTLLTSPPSQIGQLQKINLVFPKKAVVSTPLSN